MRLYNSQNIVSIIKLHQKAWAMLELHVNYPEDQWCYIALSSASNHKAASCMIQLYNSQAAKILALKLSPPDNYNPVICLFFKIEFGINFFSGIFDLSFDLKTSRFKQPF